MTAGSAEVAAHPAVAALAASIQRTDTGVSLPPAAVEQARLALRGGGDDVVVHLLALGIKTHRIAGAGGDDVVILIASLIGELLGSAQAAADRFAAAGMSKEAAAVLGTSLASRAPQATAPTKTAVKPRRGLS